MNGGARTRRRRSSASTPGFSPDGNAPSYTPACSSCPGMTRASTGRGTAGPAGTCPAMTAAGGRAAAGSATKLSIREVGKTYGAVTALADANLDLAEGELVTLLGPSGSGKTTLLMTVAGLVPPTSGEIWIDGRLATYSPPNKRDIGIVFQNYALFPHLSVFDNIAFPLRMRRMPASEIDAAVQRVLDIVQLPHVATRLPRELSGG